jgi:hypothetical protein
MRSLVGGSRNLDQAIHGVWRLIGTRALSESGNGLPPPYGAAPRGIVEFHANGRMICVLADGSDGLDPSRSYLSYTGEFSIDGDSLSTVVDGSSNPSLVGRSQVREVSLTDGLLKLITPPLTIDDDVVRREFVWKKLA